MDGDAASAWRLLLDRYPARAIDTSVGTVSIRGAGEGPSLVLLHGIGSGSGSWIYQLDRLSGRFRVIAWDAPGYGESSRVTAAPTTDAYARHLKSLVEALSLDRFLLVGHSLGALIAGRFARLFPAHLSGLLLADPASGHARLSEEQRKAKLDARIGPFEALGAERYAAERAHNLLAPNATAEHIALVRWNMARLSPDGLRDAATILSKGDLIDDVSRCEAAARVVCGAEDRVTPPADCRAVAEAFPGACPFHLIPEAGHASYIDAPESFAAQIVEFAEQVE